MKKTQIADLLSTIRKSFVPFVSIVIFVMLGIALFLGVGWAGQAYCDSAASELENHRFYDFRLVTEELLFPSGAVNRLSELEGIETEQSGMIYRVLDFRNDRCPVQFVLLPESISTCYNIEGKLPENEDEIAVIRKWAENHDVRTGEVIDGFTVTAIVDNPEYMCRAEKFYGVTPNLCAPVSAVFYVPKLTVSLFGNTLSNSLVLRFEGLRQYDYNPAAYNKASESYEQLLMDICSPYGISVVSRSSGFIQKSRLDYVPVLFGRMRITLALPFLITSILLCYTVVKRLVMQNARLVGTRKALGFTDAEIMKIYLAFAGLASALGIVLGVVAARTLIENIILSVMQQSFVFSDIVFYVSVKEIILTAAVAFALTVFFAFLSVRKALKRSTLSLLSGETVSVAKIRPYENGKLWKRMSLFGKTVINNISNDRLRVASMLTGIIGCSLVLFCGLNFTYNINSSFDVQFDSLQSFNAVVYLDPSKAGSEDSISGVLDSQGIPCMPAHIDVGQLYDSRKSNCSTAWLYSSPAGDFGGLLNVIDENGMHSVQDEAWISYGFSESAGVQPGDICTFKTIDGKTKEFPVSGSFEHHLCDAQILMSDSAYEKYTGSVPLHNAFLVHLEGGITDDLTSALKECDGYICTEDYYTKNRETYDIFSTLCSAASIVFVAISFVMVFVVINNLLAMYIAEKKKEITVLLINGYSVAKAKQYIYLDTILLSVVGIAAGTVLGYMLCCLSINSVTTAITSFTSVFSLPMFALSTGACAAMFAAVTVMALRKIDRFDLTDITK